MFNWSKLKISRSPKVEEVFSEFVEERPEKPTATKINLMLFFGSGLQS